MQITSLLGMGSNSDQDGSPVPKEVTVEDQLSDRPPQPDEAKPKEAW
jgi:hypothetical protein